ncbi:MAG TPA: zf-HC2 domain-containing protein [Polyangia bacterium]
MTASLCSHLHPFIDGELDEAEASAFRLHLGECAVCPAELEAAMMADAIAETNLGSAVRTAETSVPVAASRPAGARRTRWTWAVPGALTLAAVAALLIWTRSGPDSNGALALLGGETHRTVDARLAYPGLDRHRPLRRDRGGQASSWVEGREQTLAQLEERQDAHGLAVASLLEGRAAEAEAHLARASESVAVLSDAAAVAIERGDAARAESLAKRALALAPGHPQAMWNLAVSLQLQGKQAEAAAAFASVATLGEPGWAEEARQRAAALTPSPR